MKTKKVLLSALLSFIGLFMISSVQAQTLPAGANAIFCKGAPVSITAAADPNATAYIWKRYDGKDLTGTSTTLTGTGATLSDTAPTTPGFYTYVSTAVNAGGCESAPSDPKTIYVLPGITAAVTSTYANNNVICAGQANAGALTAVAGNVESGAETFASTDYSYQWNKDGSPIAGATASTYTLSTTDMATPGTFNYTVTITYKDKGCTPATSSNLTVKVAALAGKPVITIN
ncbi:hypothetical protein [Mucilaginibacter sp. dw_454]|uniref:hypothetical protein n=1 Tax=Mucilaginibacter sp. dw_454 TaxID=2720079 RepID=UPI001BD695C2|nr:hypothetical protein [Mucilaginibacter sp. dw_454]